MRQKATEYLERVSTYIPKNLYKKILERAKIERRSISSEIVVLLEKAITAETSPKR
jgi:hypothetical protein